MGDNDSAVVLQSAEECHSIGPVEKIKAGNNEIYEETVRSRRTVAAQRSLSDPVTTPALQVENILQAKNSNQNHGTDLSQNTPDSEDDYSEKMDKYLREVSFSADSKEKPVCALCCKQPSNQRGLQKSHIFPESLLKKFHKIHCPKHEKHFMFDLFANAGKDAEQLVAHLFCSNCEKAASEEENYLRCFYLQYMGTQLPECQRFHFTNPKLFFSLKHILAIILFRGILVMIKLKKIKEETYCKVFCKTFFDLLEYCKERESYNDHKISERIHIFLLPNTYFNRNNIDPTYILDLQLRTPEFTIVFPSQGKSYLYTKFDCFHIALPLADDDNMDLKKCSLGDVDGHYNIPNSAEAVILFPQLLLNYNLMQIGNLVNKLSRAVEGFLIVFEQLTWIHPSTYKSPTVIQDFQKLPTPSVTEANESIKFIDIKKNTSKEEDEKLVKDGCSSSPLTSPVVKKLRKEIEDLKKQNKALEEKNKALEEQNKALRAQN